MSLEYSVDLCVERIEKRVSSRRHKRSLARSQARPGCTEEQVKHLLGKKLFIQECKSSHPHHSPGSLGLMGHKPLHCCLRLCSVLWLLLWGVGSEWSSPCLQSGTTTACVRSSPSGTCSFGNSVRHGLSCHAASSSWMPW